MAARSVLKEFKEFIDRGNVMDLAVGVIIGGAFTGVVNALVDNVVRPSYPSSREAARRSPASPST